MAWAEKGRPIVDFIEEEISVQMFDDLGRFVFDDLIETDCQ